jgi:SAM-dependent methyltransferase
MRLKKIVQGLATYLPITKFIQRRTGGSDDARYCYSVWLRHLTNARRAGLPTDPKIVAELGPGDSLGIGLAALLSGAEQYYAFDVREFANNERNARIFDTLCELFAARAPIPDSNEYPEARPRLDDYGFPHQLLTDERLSRSLDPERLASIRASIADRSDRSKVRYVVPWHDFQGLPAESVDMVYSQAVLEHVDDLPATYTAIHRWLKRGGTMSHQIDFRSHGTAEGWNGHWTYSDLTWRIMRGKRPYLINRAPCSTHLRLIREAGFEILTTVPARSDSAVPRTSLAPRFRGLSDDDLTTSGLFVQARKP